MDSVICLYQVVADQVFGLTGTLGFCGVCREDGAKMYHLNTLNQKEGCYSYNLLWLFPYL